MLAQPVWLSVLASIHETGGNGSILNQSTCPCDRFSPQGGGVQQAADE